MRAVLAIALGVLGGCSHGGNPNGACSRIIGGWNGDGITSDGGQDPEALRVVDGVMRDEHWRITRILPTAFQRERTGTAGGRPAVDAMYVTQERNDLCVAEIRTVDRGTRTMRFHPRPDGRLDVQASDSWYTLILRRR